jgi:hypothetical protein
MQIIVDSVIEGSFYGFEGGRVFKFINGQIWEQAEYKYLYHYAYRPKAQVVADRGAYYLQIEGLKERVLVKKVR